MNRVVGLLRTSIGRKLLMALTGFLLIGFLLVHMLGNLYMLQGREAINAYAAWLQANPLLWPARIGLLSLFAVHVVLGMTLAWENRAARPVRYHAGLQEPPIMHLSGSMALTGLLVLAFLVYHLAHFTFGVVQPADFHQLDVRGRPDVYGMVMAGFRNPWIVGSYVVAMLVLGVHLAHGGQSFLQTLGIRYEHGNTLVKIAGLGLVALIVATNLALPIVIYLGYAGPAEISMPLAGGLIP